VLSDGFPVASEIAAFESPGAEAGLISTLLLILLLVVYVLASGLGARFRLLARYALVLVWSLLVVFAVNWYSRVTQAH